MKIVQPVTTHGGESGWLIYAADGDLVALVQRQPGPAVPLKVIAGPHTLLSLVVTVTTQQWRSLVARVPGGEALC